MSFPVFPDVIPVFAVHHGSRVAHSMADVFADVETARKAYNPIMDNETLEQIQTKIAFLERAAAELSDVVFRQHREIQALDARLKAISDRLSGAQSDETLRPPEQERPPHY